MNFVVTLGDIISIAIIVVILVAYCIATLRKLYMQKYYTPWYTAKHFTDKYAVVYCKDTVHNAIVTVCAKNAKHAKKLVAYHFVRTTNYHKCILSCDKVNNV